MKFKTIDDAVKYWIRGFNCVPTKAVQFYLDIQDVTPVTLGDCVFFDTETDINLCGEIIDVDYEKSVYKVMVEEEYDDDDEEYEYEYTTNDNELEAIKSDDDYWCEVYEVPFDEAFLCEEEDDEYRLSTYLPQWSTMWTFNDEEDIQWIEQQENQIKMAACGFRIYYNEEFGYLFGLDFSGIDFLEEFWKPLYEIRSLQWDINDK